jgi:hypothetical protein
MCVSPNAVYGAAHVYSLNLRCELIFREGNTGTRKLDMPKEWRDMTAEEKLEWLWHKHESTQRAIAGITARLDEVGGVIIELEKQIKELQTSIAGQKGPPRGILKLAGSQ